MQHEISHSLKDIRRSISKITNFHCLLSLEKTLSKAKRFDSNNLMDLGKMQVSFEKMSIVKDNFQYYVIFHTIMIKMQRNE